MVRIKYNMSFDSSDDDNLIKKVRKMPTPNILTFDEFIKNTIEEYQAAQNTTSEKHDINRFELRLRQKNQSSRSEKELVLMSTHLRRLQHGTSMRSLGHVTTPSGVL